MSEINIYQFTNAVDYLNLGFEAKRIKNARYSLRSWARQLGYENPSYLSHVLKRHRTLKLELAKKVAEQWKLDTAEKRYLEILVLLENSQSTEEKSIYFEMLDLARPRNQIQPLDMDIEVFKLVSEWQHWALLEMVELKDFKNDDEYLYQKLGKEVPRTQIRKSLDRLIQLGFLNRNSKTKKLSRTKDNPLLLEVCIPSDAVQHLHRKMIEKALTSIQGQNLQERDLRGSTLTIKMSDFAKVQDILKKAHTEIVRLSTTGEGEEVYQLNTQFFKLTKN